MKLSRYLLAALAWSTTQFACTTIRPVEGDQPPRDAASGAAQFSHELLDRVLNDRVDDRGRVDYAALAQDSSDLDAYYLQLSRISPDSHPELFPTRNDRLAYWINGYNAGALTAVLTHYPIAAVAEVKPPAALFFLPEKSGFFLLQRLLFGGESTSLYALENDLIRPRFKDPRIHFALNCASRGCPRLPNRAFTADTLEAELDRETRRFVSEDRNVRIDAAARRLYLSSLFDWYEEDYLSWLGEKQPRKKATIVDYVALYLPPEKAALLDGDPPFTVEYVDYDWGLNDLALTD